MARTQAGAVRSESSNGIFFPFGTKQNFASARDSCKRKQVSAGNVLVLELYEIQNVKNMTEWFSGQNTRQTGILIL